MNQQLSLPMDATESSAESALPARLAHRIATEGSRPFDDPQRLFEPWWPGAYALVRLAAGKLHIQTDHLSDSLAAFPELADIADCIEADGVIIEGTLLALDAAGRPDAQLLRRRLSGAEPSDVVAEGAFVASDLPYLEYEPLLDLAYEERRRKLAALLTDSARCVLGRGLVGEGVTMGHAVATLGLDAISARRLDARWRPGAAADAWLHLPVSDTPASQTRPFMVLLERLPLDG